MIFVTESDIPALSYASTPSPHPPGGYSVYYKITLLALTRWYRKNERKDIHPNPMCWKMLRSLLADPPAIRIAKHRRKLPAAICVPGMFGWLFQVKFLLVHFGLQQVLVTIAIVPSWHVVTSGLSALQMWLKTASTAESGIPHVLAECEGCHLWHGL